MKKGLKIAAVLLAGLLAVGAWALVPTYQHLLKTAEVQVDPNLRLFIGGGGNALVLRSSDGRDVLLVETKLAPAAKRLHEYIYSAGPNVHLTVVNTHYHSDHTGGNALFPGVPLIAGDYPEGMWNSEVKDRQPTERMAAGSERVLTIGDETVHIRAVGQAHTVADLIVYLEKRRLLMTGDLVFVKWNPVLRRDSGADVDKWIQVLDWLPLTYAIDTVLPGHGPITTAGALQEQREYLASIRDAASDTGRLAALREKYSDYYSLPFFSGFDRTVEYVKKR